MRWPLLLVLLSLTASADDRRGRFERFCSRSEQGRSSRGFLCDDAPFFEFAPASGTGMTTACACAAPTGAKGEVLTFSRASSATCIKGVDALRTTGIANADLVTCSNNQPRVVYDYAGVLGVQTEDSAATPLLTFFIDIANAAWSDVGTPTLTGGQTSPFAATYSASAVQVDDNDGAAFEGRSQNVTVTAGQPYTAHCYVKAGTLAKASISLDGTVGTKTGLSATTWSIVEVTDTSASAASIAFQLRNGDAAADTGTVIWGGCQVEAGSFRTSIFPRPDATAVTRAAEVASVTPGLSTGSDFSFAESFYSLNTANACAGFFATSSSNGPNIYECFNNAFVARVTAGGFSADSPSNVVGTYAWQTGVRWGVVWDRAASKSAGTVAGVLGTFGAANASVTSTAWTAVTLSGNGIHSRICGDQTQTRCR